jgi:anti-sigma regulatory factor (Ser/Thr protein kinase)
MVSKHHRSFKVGDRSHLAALKKDIHQIAVEAGFSDIQIGKIDILIAEMGSNMVKHVGSGEFLVRAVEGSHMDLFAIDNGPGIADVALMMEDGQSTSNTLGGGLGAINRLSDTSSIYTQKDWGTVIYAQMNVGTTAVKSEEQYHMYDLSVCYPGEETCGDGLKEKKTRTGAYLFLGDGLGHGKHAHDAVKAAVETLETTSEADTVSILREMNESVKKTRGLVGTLAVFNTKRNSWSICGVGNIATRTIQGIATRNHMSYNGIIGNTMPRTLNAQDVELSRGGYLVMCSDGIKTRWELTKYRGIHRCNPCMLAAALYKDFARGTDDASVVVVRML